MVLNKYRGVLGCVISGLWDLPWIIGGDFNTIRFIEWKRGNKNHIKNEGVQQAHQYLGLQDLEIKGADFTWSNNQKDVILRKLDY